METDLYSEDVQQMLNDPEPRFVKYGPYLLLGLLCCLLTIVCLVKYAERLESEITITSEIPPIPVKASVTKPLQHLFVKDHSRVEKGQLLAILDNAAHFTDVIKLKEWLKMNTTGNILSWSDSLFATTLVLGNIQINYASFIEAYQQYKLYQSLQPDHQQYQRVTQQIVNYRKLIIQQENQFYVLKEEKQLIERDYNRHVQLHDQGVISDADLESNRIKVLHIEKEIQQLQTQIARSQVDIADLERIQSKLSSDRDEQTVRLHVALTNARSKLSNDIENYERNYMMLAPITGEVLFFKEWSEHQLVPEGEELVTIMPEDHELYGKAWLPINRAGKVEIGQKVKIYLHSYPYEEYGLLEGQVTYKSAMPKEDKYIVHIRLTQGLQTSYHYQIPFQQALRGKAEIITRPTYLVERMIFHLKKADNQL